MKRFRSHLSVAFVSVFTWTLLLAPGAAHAVAYSSGTFTDVLAKEPTFDQLMRAILDQEKISPGILDKWEKRIKVAAWLPTLYAGYDHQIKQAESLTVNDTVSVSGGIVTVGPDDTNIDYDNNTGQVFRVRAVWSLDALVFNKELFNLADERRDQISLRTNLAEKVYKICEQRQLALSQYLKHRVSSSTKSAEAAVKFTLLTEWLDHLSGRKFAQKFHRIKK